MKKSVRQTSFWKAWDDFNEWIVNRRPKTKKASKEWNKILKKMNKLFVNTDQRQLRGL